MKWFPASLVLGTLLLGGSANALDEDPLRLTWRAPASCPSMKDVHDAALRDASSSKTALDADATIKRTSDGWSMVLRTRRGSVEGERHVSAASCASLGEAASVVLALALASPAELPNDAPRTGKSEPSSSTPTAPQKEMLPRESASKEISVAEAPRAETPTTTPGSNLRGSPSFAVGVWGATDPSSLPSPAVGGGGSLAWTPQRLRFEVGIGRWASQDATVPGSAAGARFSMTSATTDACFVLLRAPVEVAPCAGALVTWINAEGFGAKANYESSARWASFEGGLLVRSRVASWIALRGRVDMLVPFERPTFSVEHEGSVHRPPSFGLRASLGAELTFF